MRKALSLVAILTLMATCTFAQNAKPAAADKPTSATKPAKLQLTPEQKATVDANNKIKPWEAALRMDTDPGVEGKPNGNFGKNIVSFQKRHESFLKRAEKPIGLLFIGDSITHGWEGGGKGVFAKEYDQYQAANFGIGGDRTQHVLWRIENGELDNIKPNPKVVVIMIGTNNSGGSSAEDIAKGVTTIVDKVKEKLPESKILLLGIFPRQASPTDKDGKPAKIREKLQKVNAIINKLDDGSKIRYLEIWKEFLAEDGSIPKDIMPDALHPNAKGYQIWADTMRPLLEEMMK